AGSNGQFFRLLFNGVGSDKNRVHWNLEQGQKQRSIIEFDFRMNGTGDGFGMLLLPTSTYGTTTANVGIAGSSEEPNHAGVFAVGFDIYNNIDEISLHYGSLIQQNDLNGTIDLNNNQFHRARLEWNEGYGGVGSNISLTVTPDINGVPGTPVTFFDNLYVPTLNTYEYRLQFTARDGGATTNVDLDNIVLSFEAVPEPSTALLVIGGIVGLSSLRRRRAAASSLALLAFGLAIAFSTSNASAGIYSKHTITQNFGGGGTAYTLTGNASDTSNPGFGRITPAANGQYGSIAFDDVAPGNYFVSDFFTATFDINITPGGATNQADGFSFSLLPRGTFPNGSNVNSGAFSSGAEQGLATGGFAIGFDIHQGGGEPNNNHISIAHNGAELAIVTPSFDFSDAGTHAASLLIEYLDGGGANVSFTLDQNGAGSPETIFNNFFIAGLNQFDSRAVFAGRTGGQNALQLIDNVALQWGSIPEPSTALLLGLGLVGLTVRRRRVASNSRAAGAATKAALTGLLVVATTTFTTQSTYGFGVTIDDFDGIGLPRADVSVSAPGSVPTVVGGGPTGSFLRILDSTGGDINYSHWNRAFQNTARSVTVQFDMRLNGTADGLGLVFLPTDTYGATTASAAATGFTAEEPSIANTLAIGFDIFDVIDEISIHDGSLDAQNNLNGTINLNNNLFNRYEITWTEDEAPNSSLVSVSVTPDIFGTPGAPVDFFTNEPIDLDMYEFRFQLAGRTGGQVVTADIDGFQIGVHVPEPSTAVLLGLGLVGLISRRRRER
ncbi:MAG: PEP-CTERM sorting domain-containing protein, partial [Planctomycetales bacterium]|nr:PEP-CTERM sorting domain-containing protein [Planctomycetales bacterium]